MPYLEDDTLQDAAVERQRRRWALVGGPETGKTTSLLTFPRPCAIVSCPDELGFGSIPKHLHAASGLRSEEMASVSRENRGGGAPPVIRGADPQSALAGGECSPSCPRWQLDVFLFGAIDAQKPDWIGTCEETRRLMADLLTGKKSWRMPHNTGRPETSGKPSTMAESVSHSARETATGDAEKPPVLLRYRTVAVDGWHKLYPVYLNMFTGGALARGEEFDGRRIYPKSNAVFFGDGRRWCQSDVEWLVFTMWVDRDTDDPNTPNATSHFYPSLSGKAGQSVVGEIGITVASVRQGTGPAGKYIWLTQPDNRFWGIGCHLPPELAKKLPPFVPQDWKALVPYLGLTP